MHCQGSLHKAAEHGEQAARVVLHLILPLDLLLVDRSPSLPAASPAACSSSGRSGFAGENHLRSLQLG